MLGGHPHKPFAMGTLLQICLCSTWNQEMVMGPDHPHVMRDMKVICWEGKARQGKANILCSQEMLGWEGLQRLLVYLTLKGALFLPSASNDRICLWAVNQQPQEEVSKCQAPLLTFLLTPFLQRRGWRGQGWAPWTRVREDAGLRPLTRISTHSSNFWDPHLFPIWALQRISSGRVLMALENCWSCCQTPSGLEKQCQQNPLSVIYFFSKASRC